MGQNTRYGYKLDQTGQQTQDLLDVINNKVDKVDGKGLSANDFTDADKGKLDGIQAGAEANVQANWSQNDPSADDYVRNRTHYEETSTIRIDNALLAWSGSTSQNLDFWFHGTNVHIPRTSTGWGLAWQGGELFIDDNGSGYELGVYNGEEWSINPFDPSYDQQPYPLNVDVVITSGTTVHKLDNKFLDMDLTPTAQSDKPVMSGGVASAISSFITRSVNDLANYYLKSETYTKAEVESLIGAIQHFHYEIYPNLESVTHLANNILYLIGPTGSGTDKYEEYVYDSTKTNPWVKIGDTSIDLSGYVTTEALNTALANYVTSTALATALSAKQNTLVSGENIKTVNGQSILGSGNISIEGASDAVKYTSQSLTDAQKGQARTNIGAASDSEVSQLRSEKAEKDGYYPEMSVGSLKGTEVTQVEGITTVAKSTGIAKINEVIGRSLVWNQLMDYSEPSTVSEFESGLANNIGYRDYYAYNPGEIISNNTEALEITGLNQWDEEWEAGDLSTSGTNHPSDSQIRSKNYIQVIPGEMYYIKSPFSIYYTRLCTYDKSKNFISLESGGFYNGRLITFDEHVHFIRFCSLNDEKTFIPYNYDICLSISGARNGEYEPYQKSELELNLSSITGKLNGQGESVTIFPDGMRSAGTAFDSLIDDEDGWARRAIKRIGGVDLGTLNYAFRPNGTMLADCPGAKDGGNSTIMSNCLCPKYVTRTPVAVYNKTQGISLGSPGIAIGGKVQVYDSAYTDAATFKTAMSGVPLIYELATPQEYVLDTPIQMTFQAKHGGVIRQLPENGSEPSTAPMRMSVTYALDAVSILTDLPENYVSKESLQAMLSAMQSAGLFSAYTMTFNESTGKYEFTFTANA